MHRRYYRPKKRYRYNVGPSARQVGTGLTLLLLLIGLCVFLSGAAVFFNKISCRIAVSDACDIVTAQVNAVMDGFLHLLNVGLQVFNAVRIMDLSVLDFVKGAKTVFGNNNRKIIAGGDFPARIAQAHRVNCPVPVRGGQVLILRIAVHAGKAGDFRGALFAGGILLAHAVNAVNRIVFHA
jgi:hypothetical protein